MSTPAPQSFSWARLIYDMQLRGLPAMVALHCAPTSYDASVPQLRLELNERMAGLLDSEPTMRLKAALTEYFGEDLDLAIALGPAANSPAARAEATHVGKYASAYEAFMKDATVRSLIEEFGASILVESVRPAEGAPKPKT